jgi:hypothetical protein
LRSPGIEVLRQESALEACAWKESLLDGIQPYRQ